MGHKIHPTSFRIGTTKTWNSRWYASKEEFADNLLQDNRIREQIKEEMPSAHISHIEIERASNRVRVIIHSGRPGLVIGRKGANIERLKDQLQNIIGDQIKLFVDIKEVSEPSLDASIVADNLAFQLCRRVSFRRAMKKSLQAVKDAGGEGVRIRCAGRLGGAEIARTEGYKWGKVPLQTIRADIDYAYKEASTAYGVIGVKVWIYKGEKFDVETPEEKTESSKEEK